jgi:hypothetical protein
VYQDAQGRAKQKAYRGQTKRNHILLKRVRGNVQRLPSKAVVKHHVNAGVARRVGTDRIRRLYGVFANTVCTRIYGCGLERGKPCTYVGVELVGVLA